MCHVCVCGHFTIFRVSVSWFAIWITLSLTFPFFSSDHLIMSPRRHHMTYHQSLDNNCVSSAVHHQITSGESCWSSLHRLTTFSILNSSLLTEDTNFTFYSYLDPWHLNLIAWEVLSQLLPINIVWHDEWQMKSHQEISGKSPFLYLC